jgi:hypothetical protein
MLTYLITIGLIFGLLSAWIVVQQAAKIYARRHPEFGPCREEGSGCGSCSGGSCGKRQRD